MRIQTANRVTNVLIIAMFAMSTLFHTQQLVNAQTAQLTIGGQAPEIKLDKLLQAPRDAPIDWKGLRGKVVVLEFWATWCGPCIAAIPHLNRLAEEFSGQPVVFISITDDEIGRLGDFLKTRPMKSWIGVDTNRANWVPFNVTSLSHTVVVDSHGKVIAVTKPEHVTSQVLREVLAGKAVKLPAKESQQLNLKWDQDEIDWKDGVKPLSGVIIKPISTALAGAWLRPEGNYLTADGVPLEVLAQLAYKIGHYHMDWRLPRSTQAYRVAAWVPKGRERELLPLFQSALTATFSFKTQWQMQEKDVYVLRISANEKPTISTSGVEVPPSNEMLRGKARAKRQPLGKLTEVLTMALGLPVVDETGLSGDYDWELPYQPGQPNVTVKAVRDRLGLELVKARRAINVLIVEPSTP